MAFELSRETTPEQLQAIDEDVRELQILEAQDHLIDYVRATFPQYRPGKHHYEIAERLEAVERGEISRLMIFAPPRHGKSELVSARFPLWYIGKNPRHEVIAASYGGTLAGNFGRMLRNLTQHPMHREIFPDAILRPDSKARDHWLTKSGSRYIAAGIGGAITGYGANLLIIDDPVKSHEDAESETMRENAWNWYTFDAYTRLMTPDAIVVVQTRWHEDDFSGRLLDAMQEGYGDEFELLHLKAIDDDGEALWPEKYGLDWLERRKEVVGPKAWQSLYQGDPTPDDGTYFKRGWFWEYDDGDLMVEAGHKDGDGEPVMIARPMQYYGASDYAVSDGEGDYTVHVVVGVDPLENIYLVDLWRGQADSDKWVEQMLDMVERWKPLMWAEEKGQILKAVGPFLEKRTMERNKERTLRGEAPIFVHRQGFTSAADKRTRARAIQQRMAQGKVRFPKGAPWYPDLKSEMLKFDAGKNDDQVDAMGLVGRMLAGLTPGRMPTKADRPAVTGVMIGGVAPTPEGMRAMSLDELWAEEERMRGRGRRRR